ncbi:MAG: hypothetical protein JWO31_2233 [Phycisphaerales bacterium]|nr:hypothetical protein [Phycisphaerales bacterium]
MKLFTCLTGAVIALGVVGCKSESTTSSTGEKKTPGQMASDGMKSAGDAVGSAVNATTQKTKDLKDAAVASATPSGSSDVSGMRGLLEGVVQNAVNKGNFKTMTNHLAEPDQKRLEASNPDVTALDASIDKFKAAWAAKFGGDRFESMDKDAVFTQDFATLTSESSTTGDTKMKTGKVVIKASHGMPEVTVPVVDQDGKWRLNLDDKADAAGVVTKLQQGIDELTAMADKWPADKNQATQAVAHHILMVLTKA